MPRRVLFILFIFLPLPFYGSAATYIYDYNDNCSKAYQYYMSLRLQDARLAIVTEMKANPYNLMSTYLSDYEDCLVLLLNCDPEEYEQRSGHFESRLELLEKGDDTSPWYRFCKAGIYMHWAIVSTRFGEQYKAANRFRKSFALLRENAELFPGFEYNHVFSGLQEAVIGSLPNSYQWLASIFGMSGNMQKGIGKLAAFLSAHTARQPLYAETELYYLYTRFYMLQEKNEVWDFLNSQKFGTGNNLLHTFVKANIALDFHKSGIAVETLHSASQYPDFGKYPVFDLQLGHALLAKADVAAIDYFQRYLKNNKSDIYIKEAWQKMAYVWYINGDTQRAENCKQQVTRGGTTRLDADNQAEKFAEGTAWPPKKLLQARLLADGGYTIEAYSILTGLDPAGFKPGDKAEYYFRLGRAYDEMGKTTKAMGNYQAAINTGKRRHEQFAARAALLMGAIYEHDRMNEKALAKYKECLAMPAHDFQNSIDQQAKAGINRIDRN
jgi:tetratricopeptide (TPR) repeat protein